MPARVRVMVGITTVLLFGGIGASLVRDGQTGLGAALMVLAAFRAVVVVRQMQGGRDDEADQD